MEKIIKETQRFNLIIVIGVLIFIFIINYIVLKELDLISTIISIVLIIFFLISYLYYEIDENQIAYKFIPFIIKPRIIPYSDIDTITICDYSPLSDYGGWGWRRNRTTKAYTTKGNKAILLNLKNGKNILIGTQKNKDVLYNEIKNMVGHKVNVQLN